jgi:hypothetical protein
MKRNLAIPLAVALCITFAFAAASPAGASVFKPGNTAFTVKATNFTATVPFSFTLDCTTSTVSGTTPAAGLSISTAAANITFGGCTGTVKGFSCMVTVTTGGGDWTFTAGATALDPPTNNSWPLTIELGTGMGAGAMTFSLTGCLKDCVITITKVKLSHDGGTPMTWTNATMPTLDFTTFVPYSAAGCGAIKEGIATATGAYTLTTPTDINIA